MTGTSLCIPRRGRASGLTLIELLIALTLSGMLILGLVQIASAAASSTRLQRNQAQMQENARLAISIITRYVREAGFNPEPWNDALPYTGLTADSVDAISGDSDRLVVSGWSDLNCFDNRNPELDAGGKPAFFIREAAFDLNSSRGLTWQCRYGPSLAEMVTQIRRQGLVQDVDAFQVLYGEDSEGDNTIDLWVKAGQWGATERVLGVRLGLLLTSKDLVAERNSRRFQVLDERISKAGDGRLRRVIQFAAAFRSKTG